MDFSFDGRKVDRQTVKFNSLPNFPVIRHMQVKLRLTKQMKETHMLFFNEMIYQRQYIIT